MPVIIPLLALGGEPGGFLPRSMPHLMFVRALAEHIGSHEWSDVQSDAVIQVRVPSDRLLLQRFPTDKDVVGRFAFQDQLEAVLELTGFEWAVVSAAFLVRDGFLLLLDPFAQVGVGEPNRQISRIFGSPNSLIGQLSMPPCSAVHRIRIACAGARRGSRSTNLACRRVCTRSTVAAG